MSEKETGTTEKVRGVSQKETGTEIIVGAEVGVCAGHGRKYKANFRLFSLEYCLAFWEGLAGLFWSIPRMRSPDQKRAAFPSQNA